MPDLTFEEVLNVSIRDTHVNDNKGVEVDPGYIELVKEDITIKFTDCPSTNLVILAKSSNNDPITKIKCSGGTPIGGYVYDAAHHCYYARCVKWLNIGYISLSIMATMSENSLWMVNMPIPEAIITKYLNNDQVNKLNEFKDRFPDHVFEFVQMVD